MPGTGNRSSLKTTREDTMSNLLKNIIRFILFIVIQVLILNEVPPLHQFIVPYLYFLIYPLAAF
jgi:hypothetical protein